MTSSNDSLSVVHGPLTGYELGEITSIPSGESFVVQLQGGQIEILKTYNSFQKIDDKTVRPFFHDDLKQLSPGVPVLVKRGDDGQLTGIFERPSHPRKLKLKLF